MSQIWHPRGRGMKSGDVEEKRSLGRYHRSPPAQQTPGCLLFLCLHPLPSLACPGAHLPPHPRGPASLTYTRDPPSLGAASPPSPTPTHCSSSNSPPLVSWLPCCWLSCRLHVLVTQWSPQRGPHLLTPPLALAPAAPRSTLSTSPPPV